MSILTENGWKKADWITNYASNCQLFKFINTYEELKIGSTYDSIWIYKYQNDSYKVILSKKEIDSEDYDLGFGEKTIGEEKILEFTNHEGLNEFLVEFLKNIKMKIANSIAFMTVRH